MNFPKLRFLAFCFVALSVVSIAFAETTPALPIAIRFDPPNVTVNHSVDAIVTGVWSNSCLPSVKNVFIADGTITLRLDGYVGPAVGCLAALTQYTRTFHLGVLPAGSYNVITIADFGSFSTELLRGPLMVRDTETLSITPYAIPASGGQIGMKNPFFLAGASLTIGGVTVPANSSIDGALFADAPPHAPGIVDVVVNSTARTVTAKASLIYYDPAQADPSVFEPVLFPLSFQGSGAFGSQWTTENYITSWVSSALFRDALPCAGCSARLDAGTKQLINNGNLWGHVLYAMRGTTSSLDFGSRIRDTSRQAQTAGTEVRVARERDFRGQLRFLNVPGDSRYRVMVRLWSLGDFPQFIVNIDLATPQVAPISVTKIPGTSMWFGSADITSLVAKGNGNPTSVMVYPSGYGSIFASQLFPPIWGMLSITNNDTQQVTVVSPQ
jgi:hypothetical protein